MWDFKFIHFGLTEFHCGSQSVHYREAGIPPSPVVANARIQVECRAVSLRGREGRVIAIFQVQSGTIEGLRQQGCTCANTQATAPQLLVVGILNVELLVLEQTYLIVHETGTYAMCRTKEPQWQVCRDDHRGRRMLIAQHLQGIAALHVNLTFQTGSSGIIKRLQRPIMIERSIVLSAHAGACPQQYEKKETKSSQEILSTLLVGIPGFEPGKTEPKPVVLPLHHIPILRPLLLKARQKYAFFMNRHA